ncbi:MAG: hypothetical protein AAF384_18500 [Pseudomonadota bacterium]
MTNQLPEGFEDLLPFVPQWVFSTERERNAFRVQQPMRDLKAFYDATLPRLDDIATHLDRYPLDAMPRAAANLLELALMSMEVAPAIEYYNSPDVPNSVEFEKFEILSAPLRYQVVD